MSLRCLLLLTGALAGGLELQVQPLRPAYHQGESVVVRVLVRNPPESERTWHLKRTFWLVPFSVPTDGDLALSLQVIGPDGQTLEGTTAGSMVVRMQTHPLMFVPLHPGEVFGAELALDGRGLEYKMADPGVYHVNATLTPVNPREWFEDWLLSNGERDRAPVVPDGLFEGTLRGSTEVRVVE
jgi:hypothetical protein